MCWAADELMEAVAELQPNQKFVRERWEGGFVSRSTACDRGVEACGDYVLHTASWTPGPQLQAARTMGLQTRGGAGGGR